MKSTYSLFILFTVLFAACTEEGLIEDTQTPIVEGFLFAGQPVDSFQISQSYAYIREDTTLITLNDLEVTVKSDNGTIILNNIGNGIYQNLDFSPESGLSYSLEFEYNGNTISAETYIPEKQEIEISTDVIELEKITGFPTGGIPEVDPIEISWPNGDGDYYYVLVENIEDDPEFVNDLLAEFLADGRARRFFRITEPEITDFHALDTRRDLTQFGTYRIIVFRVNPEYAALYESSGTSSITITQPPSNIVNGLGIFTGVSSDTTFLEVKKI